MICNSLKLVFGTEGESSNGFFFFLHIREIYTPYYENKGKDGINYVRIFVGGDGTRGGYCSTDLTYINFNQRMESNNDSFLFILNALKTLCIMERR